MPLKALYRYHDMIIVIFISVFPSLYTDPVIYTGILLLHTTGISIPFAVLLYAAVLPGICA